MSLIHATHFLCPSVPAPCERHLHARLSPLHEETSNACFFRRRLHIFATFLFSAKKGLSEIRMECFSRFCAPIRPRSTSITRTAHTSTMDVHGVHGVQDVRDAASVLGLQSYVGPLTDMTIAKPRVQQSFDHNLLNPARVEIKRGLRANDFEAQHVDLARELLRRIKDLQRKRDERDRKRLLREKEKQVSSRRRVSPPQVHL